MTNETLLLAASLGGLVTFFVALFWSSYDAKRIAKKFLEVNRPLASQFKTRRRQTRLIFKACADYNLQWGWHFSAKLPDDDEIWLFVAMFPSWVPGFGMVGFGKRLVVEFRADKEPEIFEQQISLQLGGKIIAMGEKKLKELFQVAVLKQVVINNTGEVCWTQSRIWREDGAELVEAQEGQI